tara:strand:- start:84 stop:893 length:810 start_codon:yes stop_codon:yes gene_type:complete
MASTYTNNNGIELIGSGEQAGAWGTTTNTNFEIIDKAINGVLSIQLTGTTTTLSTSNGDKTSEGLNKVLVLAGTPSGTNTITISPNNVDKLYFVVNTSGQSVVFTQGSGGDVTVPNGNNAILFCDGTGTGATVTDLSPNTLSNSGANKIQATATGVTVTGTAIATTSTDATNTGDVTLDFQANQNFVLTLTGNVTLKNPTTEQVGQSGFIVFIQDGTGNRTLSLDPQFFTPGGLNSIALSSAANAVDIVPYVVKAADQILLGSPQLNFS